MSLFEKTDRIRASAALASEGDADEYARHVLAEYRKTYPKEKISFNMMPDGNGGVDIRILFHARGFEVDDGFEAAVRARAADIVAKGEK